MTKVAVLPIIDSVPLEFGAIQEEHVLKLEWVFEDGKCVQVRWVMQEADQQVKDSSEVIEKAS